MLKAQKPGRLDNIFGLVERFELAPAGCKRKMFESVA
jgi:hypothetical protein